MCLALASKIFYVYVDPKILEVESALPGANCGGCGYPGCAGAAEAIATGKAPANICVGGGPDVQARVAEIMGVELLEAEPEIAQPGCYYGTDKADLKYIYDGFGDCRAAMLLDGGPKVCSVGCIGLGTCVSACPFDALSMGSDGLPVVDLELCTGCGTCERVCPKNIISLRNMTQKLLHFNDPNECLAPCRQTCPAEINIPLYIKQVREGDYEGAVHTIRERNPLLLTCGRVCPHPCEDACRRGAQEDPVAINYLKRFVADYEMNSKKRYPIRTAPPTNHRVAIIGGGPAGLSCAYFLARLGHSATIFEAMPKLGGMLRYGIPEYRLPKAVLDWEIEGILNLGVEHRTNVRFGVNFNLDQLVIAGYEAIFLGIGAWRDARLNVKGEDLEGCYTGIDFLARVGKGDMPPVPKRAAVIGGGNTAVDCARTLLRMGAEEVTMVYRRTRKEMPANELEIEASEHEGIKFLFLAAPTQVVGDEEGKVVNLEYLRMELGEPDASGRRRPVPVKGSETLLEVDMVITAIGQSPDVGFLEESKSMKNLKVTRWNTIVVDEITLQSEDIPFVFAAGDAFTGPSLVVEAIGTGRRAAASMHRYLGGEEKVRATQRLLLKDRIPGTFFTDVEDIVPKPRSVQEELEVDDRIHNFEEVELCLSEKEAKRESERCLYCGLICYHHEADKSRKRVA